MTRRYRTRRGKAAATSTIDTTTSPDVPVRRSKRLAGERPDALAVNGLEILKRRRQERREAEEAAAAAKEAAEEAAALQKAGWGSDPPPFTLFRLMHWTWQEIMVQKTFIWQRGFNKFRGPFNARESSRRDPGGLTAGDALHVLKSREMDYLRGSRQQKLGPELVEVTLSYTPKARWVYTRAPDVGCPGASREIRATELYVKDFGQDAAMLEFLTSLQQQRGALEEIRASAAGKDGLPFPVPRLMTAVFPYCLACDNDRMQLRLLKAMKGLRLKDLWPKETFMPYVNAGLEVSNALKAAGLCPKPVARARKLLSLLVDDDAEPVRALERPVMVDRRDVCAALQSIGVGMAQVMEMLAIGLLPRSSSPSDIANALCDSEGCLQPHRVLAALRNVDWDKLIPILTATQAVSDDAPLPECLAKILFDRMDPGVLRKPETSAAAAVDAREPAWHHAANALLAKPAWSESVFMSLVYCGKLLQLRHGAWYKHDETNAAIMKYILNSIQCDARSKKRLRNDLYLALTSHMNGSFREFRRLKPCEVPVNRDLLFREALRQRLLFGSLYREDVERLQCSTWESVQCVQWMVGVRPDTQGAALDYVCRHWHTVEAAIDRVLVQHHQAAADLATGLGRVSLRDCSE